MDTKVLRTTTAIAFCTLMLVACSKRTVPQPNVLLFGDGIRFDAVDEPERNAQGLYTVKATCEDISHIWNPSERADVPDSVNSTAIGLALDGVVGLARINAQLHQRIAQLESESAKRKGASDE